MDTNEDGGTDAPGGPDSGARPGGWPRRLAAALVVCALAGLVLVPLWRARPRLTSEEARSLVLATLQRETRQAFVVTGALDITVTTRVQNVRRLLPGLLDLSLGTVESTVRAPGRVSYGFPVAELKAESITVRGDTIELRVPSPRVYAVEAALERMEVETRTGWLRVRENTQLEVQQRATELVSSALRQQAARHLRDSEQPRINTAETLHELLRPAFEAAGITEPVFRFVINEQLVYVNDR